MIGTFGCLYSWVFLVCLDGFLIIVRFSCCCYGVNCGFTGVCYTMHFPLQNIRHQIFVERNWINTTGHYFHSSANFCPRSSFSSSKYSAVFVISYRTLQVFNPVGNFCALIQIRSFLRCKWRLCLLSAGIRQLFFCFHQLHAG